MAKQDERRWGVILDQVRKFKHEQLDKADVFERERKQNIEKRYNLLKEALLTGYATDLTLKMIALLGVEFEATKAGDMASVVKFANPFPNGARATKFP